MFRSKFSEDIFNHKYRHEGAETWASLARTLVEDVCSVAGNAMSPEDRDQLEEYIRDMKFLPGGRYLYYAGRPNKFFNNCFGGETKVLTDGGWITLGECVDHTVNVLSPMDGKFYPATVHSHGVQKLRRITFASVRGHQQETKTVRATRTHRWVLSDGTDTYDLRVGDVVPSNMFDVGDDAIGFVHGLVFGDGNRNGQIRLCADKDKRLLNRIGQYGSITYPPSAKGDPVVYFNHPVEWKELPRKDASAQYIASFIRGWLAADGSETSGNKLCSVNKEAMEWFRDYAAYAGIVISGKLRSQTRTTRLGDKVYEDHEIFIQNYAYGDAYPGFKVVAIEEDGEEEVFCPFEPVHQQIVIDHNIQTGNCYLLKAEEDSREDWADLSWKAESCLMTGGGIGVDYSVYRGEGAPIQRTGGQASGPIPKMNMINEIGRRVMQGGSRRSAIYASLNWQHADVHQFLKAKDWADMPVAGTDKTLWDVKQSDFNFPAPLDMTNISVNYDTKWLLEYYQTGNPGNVFKENVRQALKTAEPGFSFNFFDKENETLRNACTEVTSEDDSDVCNLGSINLGRIEGVEELADVVVAPSRPTFPTMRLLWSVQRTAALALDLWVCTNG
jgi:hypothetical protein